MLNVDFFLEKLYEVTYQLFDLKILTNDRIQRIPHFMGHAGVDYLEAFGFSCASLKSDRVGDLLYLYHGHLLLAHLELLHLDLKETCIFHINIRTIRCLKNKDLFIKVGFRDAL